MKNVCLLLLLLLTNIPLVTCQLNCIHCFEQNEPINTGVTSLILNGGFENTTCTPGWFQDVFCPNSSLYNCDLSNWICTDGDAQSYPSVFDSTKSFIPEGHNAAYFGNGNAFACSEQWGDSSCYTINSCAVTGIPTGYPRSNPGYGGSMGVSIAQTVSGLMIGQTYVLEFWAGGEPLSGLLSGRAVFAVDVGFGKTFLTCNPTGEPGPLTGTRYLIVFDANATSHQIKFTNWGHTCDICTELVIDDVSLYTIEELPGTVQDCNTATEETKEKSDILVYPNPFTESINITLELVPSDKVTLDIYNINGQQIDRLFDGSLAKGKHEISWDPKSNPPGIYSYQLIVGHRHVMKGKVIYLK